jgi:hypothetical protein
MEGNRLARPFDQAVGIRLNLEVRAREIAVEKEMVDAAKDRLRSDQAEYRKKMTSSVDTPIPSEDSNEYQRVLNLIKDMNAIDGTRKSRLADFRQDNRGLMGELTSLNGMLLLKLDRFTRSLALSAAHPEIPARSFVGEYQMKLAEIQRRRTETMRDFHVLTTEISKTDLDPQDDG